MSLGDYWHGLTLSWWLLCRDGSASAVSSDLAALWHDDGSRAVLLGTYAEAREAAARLYLTPPEIPETLFDRQGVAA